MLQNKSKEDVTVKWDGKKYVIPAGEKAAKDFGVGIEDHMVKKSGGKLVRLKANTPAGPPVPPAGPPVPPAGPPEQPNGPILGDIWGVGSKTEALLEQAGFDTVKKVAEASIEDLVAAGVQENTVTKVKASAEDLIKN